MFVYRLGEVNISCCQGVLLSTDREAAIEEQVPLKAEIQALRKALGEAQERLILLEDCNLRLTSLAANYRVKWINEARQADVLERHVSLGISQAGWLSSSPDRSDGADEDMIDDQAINTPE